jgi:cell division GTPase FtsZ
MKADELLFISLGGAAASIARHIAAQTRQDPERPPMRVLVLDTDDAVLQTVTHPHTEGVSVTIFGTQRLDGKGTGGDHVLGASAFRDDAATLMQQIGSPRLAIILTCCGGGTSGACESLLRFLNERGIANIVFATEPLPFEGDDRKRCATVVIPTLMEHANAASIIPLTSLIPEETAGLTIEQSFNYAANRLAAGISLLWVLLVSPGYLQFDAEHFRQILDQSTSSSLSFTFSDATAIGEERATDLVKQIVGSPRFMQRGVNCLANASTAIVGVLAGEDLRLCELNVLMTGLRSHFNKQTEVILGTVNHPTFSGRMEVVVLAFRSLIGDMTTSNDALQPLARKRSIKGGREKMLSAVKNRFDNVEQTIIDGINYDEPTYLRRNIRLKR